MNPSGVQAITRELLVAELDGHRDHVLDVVEGISETEMDRPAAPSGWSPRSMVSHLLFDVEVFWVGAVLGADEDAISRIRDGWTAPPIPGERLCADYRSAVAGSNQILREIDLQAPPAWWPPQTLFGGPRLRSGLQVVLRVLGETATHAGHLDLARERIDGYQHLVVT